MTNAALCAMCWLVCSAVAFPLTAEFWMEGKNTCCPANPLMFFFLAGNLCCAFAYGRQLFKARPMMKMVGFWVASASYNLLPLVVIVVFAGIGELAKAYDSIGKHFTWSFFPLVWMPLVGILSLSFAAYGLFERSLDVPEARPFTREHWQYHWVFSCVAVIAGSITARHHMWWSDLQSLEQRAGSSLARAMCFHTLIFTNDPITTVTQIFTTTRQNPREYLEYLEGAFANYGRYAGFEKSIEEKYRFVEPGLTNRYPSGELVVVSSMPYPGADGKFQRMVVMRAGAGGDYYAQSVDERSLEGIFREAGRPLPTFQLSIGRVKGMPIHIRLAEVLGIGAEWAVEMCVALVGAMGFALWRLLRHVGRSSPG